MIRPVSKLIRLTIGSAIAPHCCISSTQSRQRNLCGLFASPVALITHSPTNVAISFVFAHTSCAARPTIVKKFRERSTTMRVSFTTTSCRNNCCNASGKSERSQ